VDVAIFVAAAIHATVHREQFWELSDAMVRTLNFCDYQQ
jgi:hypothetical protein